MHAAAMRASQQPEEELGEWFGHRALAGGRYGEAEGGVLAAEGLKQRDEEPVGGAVDEGGVFAQCTALTTCYHAPFKLSNNLSNPSFIDTCGS